MWKQREFYFEVSCKKFLFALVMQVLKVLEREVSTGWNALEKFPLSLEKRMYVKKSWD